MNNDLMEEFEAEFIDILNAATKEAFIAGYQYDGKRGNHTALTVYNKWVAENE
jgi:hypothetical protein